MYACVWNKNFSTSLIVDRLCFSSCPHILYYIILYLFFFRGKAFNTNLLYEHFCIFLFLFHWWSHITLANRLEAFIFFFVASYDCDNVVLYFTALNNEKWEIWKIFRHVHKSNYQFSYTYLILTLTITKAFYFLKNRN